MRPMRFLLNAYLPEHYKNRTGSTRKVRGKNLGQEIVKFYRYLGIY